MSKITSTPQVARDKEYADAFERKILLQIFLSDLDEVEAVSVLARIVRSQLATTDNEAHDLENIFNYCLKEVTYDETNVEQVWKESALGLDRLVQKWVKWKGEEENAEHEGND